jgi:hypothetical protein
VNFSHKIVPYAHLIVNKGSRAIGDGMKGKTTLQKHLKDMEIGIMANILNIYFPSVPMTYPYPYFK